MDWMGAGGYHSSVFKVFLFFFSAMSIIAQDTGALSDAEEHGSLHMNAAAAEAATETSGGVRVVFLGNSITLHSVLPSIGWMNEWGMAASAAEKDYVHLVTRGIERETGRRADVRIRNLADFERGFKDYDFGREKDLADFNPDFLVVALGENVPALQTGEERLAFRDAVKKLLAGFMRERSTPIAVVRGVFWKNDWKDAMMAHAASDFSIPFVPTGDLGDDPSMRATGLFKHTGVAAHPGDKGMAATAARILEGLFPKASGYEVWDDGRPAKVLPVRLSRQPFNQWGADYQRPMDQTEIGGLLKFETEGATTLRVRPDRTFEKAVVRPLSAGVKPVVAEGEVTFTLPRPGYYVLELDGHHQPLEIFADPARDFARERTEANIVFGPGIHMPVVVKLQSGDRVYLDKDAFVYGSFQADGVEDVEVSGYGIICGTRNLRVAGNHCYREGMDGAVRIIDSKQVRFDGPTVLDSSCWCVAAFNSSDLEFSRIKVTAAWRYNTDGIDICNSQRVRIRDCYVHAFDDAIVLKGNWPLRDRRDPVEDVLVERCVCWCSWGRTLEIGLETWAPRFRRIAFRDCDLIHNNHAALSLHLGGPAKVEDVTYRDIRIEYAASEEEPIYQGGGRDQKVDCKSPWTGNWLSEENGKMFGPGTSYEHDGFDPAKEPYGTFDRATVDNIDITVEEGAPLPRRLTRPQPGTTFGSISITNVRINGKPIH
jgi:hypothetical protein